MNKRDWVLSLLDRDKKQEVIPAAFFLHFDEVYHRGQAAIEKHQLKGICVSWGSNLVSNLH